MGVLSIKNTKSVEQFQDLKFVAVCKSYICFFAVLQTIWGQLIYHMKIVDLLGGDFPDAHIQERTKVPPEIIEFVNLV